MRIYSYAKPVSLLSSPELTDTAGVSLSELMALPESEKPDE
jgi:hypothetical protein